MTDGLGNHFPEERRDTAADLARAGDGAGGGDSAARNLDDAAALVLGALTDAEYDTAMRRLEREASFRREVAELGAVARLLPILVELPDADQLPGAAGADAGDMAPSAALRGRIMDSILADGPGPAEPRRARVGPERAAPRPTESAARAGGSPTTIPSSRSPRGNTASVGAGVIDPRRGANLWLTMVMGAVILVFAVAAIALQVRNSNLQSQVDELRAQVVTLDQQTVALQNEVQLANAQSNASAWVLNPDPGAGDVVPAEAGGTVFYSYREQSVVSEVRGLPELPDNGVYQLWYLGGVPGDEAPRSAGLMEFTADGTAVFTAEGVAEPFDAVAVSIEPAGGSETPTTVIMIGTLSAAG